MSNPTLNAEAFERAVSSFDSTVDVMRTRVCPEMQGAADQHYKAAETFERSVNKLVQAMGMQAENDHAKAAGSSLPYTEGHFRNL